MYKTTARGCYHHHHHHHDIESRRVGRSRMWRSKQRKVRGEHNTRAFKIRQLWYLSSIRYVAL
jgi:hypothetical protein